MNLSWIDALLCVGGHLDDAQLRTLVTEQGVRHVVDLRAERSDDAALLEALGAQLTHIPTADHHPMALDALTRGIAAVLAGLARGERTFIHCEHGIGRSVFLTACVLVKLGASPQEAMRRIKRLRACASPSPAQLCAFSDWSCAEGHAYPHFDELAAIVYHAQAELRP